jgi:hypothetical protein
MSTLLTREEFKQQVFFRDKNRCIICKLPAVDAHHIIDRSLFSEDCGYYLDNGVSLCAEHHLQAEQTIISCKTLRAKAGITNIILPEHFDTEEEWDHWGNILLHSGARLRGELFFQENVQRALKEGGMLTSFMPYVKYPRTYHLPTSPNLQNDDRQHKNVDELIKLPLIASIKIDGENCTFYSDYIHARSIDSKHHASRAWVKALHGQIKHEIPEGYRICGENIFAKHSIHYQHLKDYFYVFSIWNERNEALSWADTEEYCEILGLHTVPVFFRGETTLDEIHNEYLRYCLYSPDPVEGYVIRHQGSIPYHMFKTLTAKYVRKGHVQTSEFWMSQPVVSNILEKGPIYLGSEMSELLSLIQFHSYDDIHASLSLSDIFNVKETLHFCKDSIMFKYYLDSCIKATQAYIDGLADSCTIKEELYILNIEKELYNVLFCDLNEVPLIMDGKFPHVCKWRLEHGK